MARIKEKKGSVSKPEMPTARPVAKGKTKEKSSKQDKRDFKSLMSARSKVPQGLIAAIDAFLNEFGYKKTRDAFGLEKRRDSAVETTKDTQTPSLTEIYESWNRNRNGPNAIDATVKQVAPSKSLPGHLEIDDDSSSSSGSESDVSSTSDSDAEMKDATRDPKILLKDSTRMGNESKLSQAKSKKRKAEFTSASDSDSSSDSDKGRPARKKAKIKRRPSPASSSSSASDSSSNSSQSNLESKSVSATDSDTNSDSDSTDDSDSASEPAAKKSKNGPKKISLDQIAAHVPLPDSTSDSSEDDDHTDSSSDASSTLTSSSEEEKSGNKSAPKPNGTKHIKNKDRQLNNIKAEIDETATPLAVKDVADPASVNGTPASTNSKTKHTGAKPTPLAQASQQENDHPSNSYIPYAYAERAYKDLSITRGKGFTKEKNKKKRGSYRGGPIDIGPGKSFKFED